MGQRREQVARAARRAVAAQADSHPGSQPGTHVGHGLVLGPIRLGAPHQAGARFRQPLRVGGAEGQAARDDRVLAQHVGRRQRVELPRHAHAAPLARVHEPRDAAVRGAVGAPQGQGLAGRVGELVAALDAQRELVVAQGAVVGAVVHDGRDTGDQVAQAPEEEQLDHRHAQRRLLARRVGLERGDPGVAVLERGAGGRQEERLVEVVVGVDQPRQEQAPAQLEHARAGHRRLDHPSARERQRLDRCALEAEAQAAQHESRRPSPPPSGPLATHAPSRRRPQPAMTAIMASCRAPLLASTSSARRPVGEPS